MKPFGAGFELLCSNWGWMEFRHKKEELLYSSKPLNFLTGREKQDWLPQLAKLYTYLVTFFLDIRQKRICQVVCVWCYRIFFKEQLKKGGIRGCPAERFA